MWLVMTTGLRRGEVCILRWSRVNPDTGEIEIRTSYRLRKGVGTEKDTKTHQMRRIAWTPRRSGCSGTTGNAGGTDWPRSGWS